MKHSFLIPTLLFLQGTLVSAQGFVNGSFETNTAPPGCNYNLGNATFNSLISNTNAYGPGQELDILVAGCYNPTIPNGTKAVGVAADPSDEFAMALTAPLVPGNPYIFTFSAYSEVSFRPQGNLQVGASTNNNSFGTLLYTAVTVPNVWTLYSVSFTAAAAYTHITVRNQAGAIYWNHVDNFVMGVPLPVELLNFSGHNQPNKVVLDWNTASEVNNDYFIVERSADAINFAEIGRVTGAGTSNIHNNYTLTDPDPFTGINYYRLRQTDYDGGFEFSEMISVNAELIESEIFPNPAHTNLNIHIETSEPVRITMLNSMGQVVKNEMISGEYIDISDLPNGIYFIYIYTEQQTIVKKLVKE